jgi:acyl carrier protein
MNRLEDELKQLIVEALFLESVKPADIDAEAPLFGAGLGLDSIDALELTLAVEQRYQVKIRPEDENVKAIFGSVRNLAAHIARQRPDAGA